MIIEVQGWCRGTRLCSVRLAHGNDPAEVLAERGFVLEAPLDAATDPVVGTDRAGPQDRLVIRFRVRQAAPRQAGPQPVPTDRHLRLAPGEAPVRLQRVGAYAVVLGRRGLLATRYSARTNRVGTWGLPGGGLDPGEDPAAAARRECWEETGQIVDVGELLLVQSAHWVGRSPAGRAEDFHAVRLVYRGDCSDPTDPVVHDTAGTTAAAAWVRPAELAGLAWSTPAREQLTRVGLLLAR